MYLHYIVHSTYVTSSAKTRHVCITTEVNFITPAYRYTQWLSIPSASKVNVTSLHFWREFCLLPIMTGTLTSIEGTNWVVGTQDLAKWALTSKIRAISFKKNCTNCLLGWCERACCHVMNRSSMWIWYAKWGICRPEWLPNR